MKRTIYGALAAVFMSAGLLALSLVFHPSVWLQCGSWCWPFG